MKKWVLSFFTLWLLAIATMITVVCASGTITTVTTESDLRNALSAAPTASVDLGGAITASSQITVNGTKTLDLNGKKLSFYNGDPSTTSKIFDIISNVDFTINDRADSGEIDGLVSVSSGKITINGGKFSKSFDISSSSTAIINGGSFESVNFSSSFNQNSRITGGYFTKITVQNKSDFKTLFNISSNGTSDIVIFQNGTVYDLSNFEDSGSTAQLRLLGTDTELKDVHIKRDIAQWFSATAKNATFDGTKLDPVNYVTLTSTKAGYEGLTVTLGQDYTVALGTSAQALSAESYTKAGTYNVKITGIGNNYTGDMTTTWKVQKAAARTNLTNMEARIKVGDTKAKTVKVNAAERGMPTDAGTLTYSDDSQNHPYTINGDVQVTSLTIGKDGTVTYALSGGKAGDIITVPVVVASENYEDSIFNLVITMTEKDVPTGQPEYTSTLPEGSTLKDANLKIGTLQPNGTIAWEDGDATKIVEGQYYQWIFTPSDSSYEIASDSVTFTLTKDNEQEEEKPNPNPNSPSTSPNPPSNTNNNTDNGNSNSGSNSNSTNSNVPVTSDDKGNYQVDLTGTNGNLSGDVIRDLVNNHANSVIINLPGGITITLDNTALNSLNTGEDINFKISSSTGDKRYVEVLVEIEIVLGEVIKTSFDGGILTVSVPFIPNTEENQDVERLTVWYEHDNGNIDNLGGYYDYNSKSFIFETNHLSQYVLIDVDKLINFEDVPADVYYLPAVAWAVENGITNGVTETLFAPEQGCTRGQIVAFLWRAAGSPEPKSECTFTDVSSEMYYAKAVAWAVENGITNGIGNNQFGPDEICTRAQAVTFLYRAAGSPRVSTPHSFDDVFDTDYYVNAVIWASKLGITEGVDENSFAPDLTCTRAQIVTFLWRAYLAENQATAK